MLLQWRKPRAAAIHLHSKVTTHSYPFSSSTPGGRRPKKKIYHREPDLDRAMDLNKTPSLLLRLRSIIISSKNGTVLLRDLEKEVGFVQKWTFVNLIEKHPTIFRVSGGGRAQEPISVGLTQSAIRVSEMEGMAREEMEPIVVRNLRKLLMMSMDCQVPMEKVRLIAADLGLPEDFKDVVIRKYPQFFEVRNFHGREYLCLESWESTLAVTEREERSDFFKHQRQMLGESLDLFGRERHISEESLNLHGTEKQISGQRLDFKMHKKKEIPRDGNYLGPHAFKLSFPSGFRPNTHYLKEIIKWQKLAFPSPYLNARRIEPATPQARKRAVAVLHEILSLTMMKRLSFEKLDAFHNEYQLPCRLLLCLVKNHGMFYITNKGERSTVFLKEGYDGCYLVEKCPLIRFYDRFVGLCGRKCPDSSAVALGWHC